MCDKTETVANTPIPENGYSKMYVPNGREDLQNCITALRHRADSLEALLKSIPESITPEAHNALQFISGYFWRNL